MNLIWSIMAASCCCCWLLVAGQNAPIDLTPEPSDDQRLEWRVKPVPVAGQVVIEHMLTGRSENVLAGYTPAEYDNLVTLFSPDFAYVAIALPMINYCGSPTRFDGRVSVFELYSDSTNPSVAYEKFYWTPSCSGIGNDTMGLLPYANKGPAMVWTMQSGSPILVLARPTEEPSRSQLCWYNPQANMDMCSGPVNDVHYGSGGVLLSPNGQWLALLSGPGTSSGTSEVQIFDTSAGDFNSADFSFQGTTLSSIVAQNGASWSSLKSPYVCLAATTGQWSPVGTNFGALHIWCRDEYNMNWQTTEMLGAGADDMVEAQFSWSPKEAVGVLMAPYFDVVAVDGGRLAMWEVLPSYLAQETAVHYAASTSALWGSAGAEWTTDGSFVAVASPQDMGGQGRVDIFSLTGGLVASWASPNVDLAGKGGMAWSRLMPGSPWRVLAMLSPAGQSGAGVIHFIKFNGASAALSLRVVGNPSDKLGKGPKRWQGPHFLHAAMDSGILLRWTWNTGTGGPMEATGSEPMTTETVAALVPKPQMPVRFMCFPGVCSLHLPSYDDTGNAGVEGAFFIIGLRGASLTTLLQVGNGNSAFATASMQASFDGSVLSIAAPGCTSNTMNAQAGLLRTVYCPLDGSPLSVATDVYGPATSDLMGWTVSWAPSALTLAAHSPFANGGMGMVEVFDVDSTGQLTVLHSFSGTAAYSEPYGSRTDPADWDPASNWYIIRSPRFSNIQTNDGRIQFVQTVAPFAQLDFYGQSNDQRFGENHGLWHPGGGVLAFPDSGRYSDMSGSYSGGIHFFNVTPAAVSLASTFESALPCNDYLPYGQDRMSGSMQWMPPPMQSVLMVTMKQTPCNFYGMVLAVQVAPSAQHEPMFTLMGDSVDIGQQPFKYFAVNRTIAVPATFHEMTCDNSPPWPPATMSCGDRYDLWFNEYGGCQEPLWTAGCAACAHHGLPVNDFVCLQLQLPNPPSSGPVRGPPGWELTADAHAMGNMGNITLVHPRSGIESVVSGSMPDEYFGVGGIFASPDGSSMMVHSPYGPGTGKVHHLVLQADGQWSIDHALHTPAGAQLFGRGGGAWMLGGDYYLVADPDWPGTDMYPETGAVHMYRVYPNQTTQYILRTTFNYHPQFLHLVETPDTSKVILLRKYSPAVDSNCYMERLWYDQDPMSGSYNQLINMWQQVGMCDMSQLHVSWSPDGNIMLAVPSGGKRELQYGAKIFMVDVNADYLGYTDLAAGVGWPLGPVRFHWDPKADSNSMGAFLQMPEFENRGMLLWVETPWMSLNYYQVGSGAYDGDRYGGLVQPGLDPSAAWSPDGDSFLFCTPRHYGVGNCNMMVRYNGFNNNPLYQRSFAADDLVGSHGVRWTSDGSYAVVRAEDMTNNYAGALVVLNSALGLADTVNGGAPGEPLSAGLDHMCGVHYVLLVPGENSGYGAIHVAFVNAAGALLEQQGFAGSSLGEYGTLENPRVEFHCLLNGTLLVAHVRDSQVGAVSVGSAIMLPLHPDGTVGAPSTLDGMSKHDLQYASFSARNGRLLISAPAWDANGFVDCGMWTLYEYTVTSDMFEQVVDGSSNPAQMTGTHDYHRLASNGAMISNSGEHVVVYSPFATVSGNPRAGRIEVLQVVAGSIVAALELAGSAVDEMVGAVASPDDIDSSGEWLALRTPTLASGMGKLSFVHLSGTVTGFVYEQFGAAGGERLGELPGRWEGTTPAYAVLDDSWVNAGQSVGKLLLICPSTDSQLLTIEGQRSGDLKGAQLNWNQNGTWFVLRATQWSKDDSTQRSGAVMVGQVDQSTGPQLAFTVHGYYMEENYGRELPVWDQWGDRLILKCNDYSSCQQSCSYLYSYPSQFSCSDNWSLENWHSESCREHFLSPDCSSCPDSSWQNCFDLRIPEPMPPMPHQNSSTHSVQYDAAQSKVIVTRLSDSQQYQFQNQPGFGQNGGTWSPNGQYYVVRSPYLGNATHPAAGRLALLSVQGDASVVLTDTFEGGALERLGQYDDGWLGPDTYIVALPTRSSSGSQHAGVLTVLNVSATGSWQFMSDIQSYNGDMQDGRFGTMLSVSPRLPLIVAQSRDDNSFQAFLYNLQTHTHDMTSASYLNCHKAQIHWEPEGGEWFIATGIEFDSYSAQWHTCNNAIGMYQQSPLSMSSYYAPPDQFIDNMYWTDDMARPTVKWVPGLPNFGAVLMPAHSMDSGIHPDGGKLYLYSRDASGNQFYLLSESSLPYPYERAAFTSFELTAAPGPMHNAPDQHLIMLSIPDYTNSNGNVAAGWIAVLTLYSYGSLNVWSQSTGSEAYLRICAKNVSEWEWGPMNTSLICKQPNAFSDQRGLMRIFHAIDPQEWYFVGPEAGSRLGNTSSVWSEQFSLYSMPGYWVAFHTPTVRMGGSEVGEMRFCCISDSAVNCPSDANHLVQGSQAGDLGAGIWFEWAGELGFLRSTQFSGGNGRVFFFGIQQDNDYLAVAYSMGSTLGDMDGAVATMVGPATNRMVEWIAPAFSNGYDPNAGSVELLSFPSMGSVFRVEGQSSGDFASLPALTWNPFVDSYSLVSETWQAGIPAANAGAAWLWSPILPPAPTPSKEGASAQDRVGSAGLVWHPSQPSIVALRSPLYDAGVGPNAGSVSVFDLDTDTMPALEVDGWEAGLLLGNASHVASWSSNGRALTVSAPTARGFMGDMLLMTEELGMYWRSYIVSEATSAAGFQFSSGGFAWDMSDTYLAVYSPSWGVSAHGAVHVYEKQPDLPPQLRVVVEGNVTEPLSPNMMWDGSVLIIPYNGTYHRANCGAATPDLRSIACNATWASALRRSGLCEAAMRASGCSVCSGIGQPSAVCLDLALVAASPSPSVQVSPSITPSATSSVTASTTVSPSHTASQTVTVTATPSYSVSPVPTASSSTSATPTTTPSASVTASATGTATATASGTATATASGTATATATSTATVSGTASASLAVSSTPSPSSTASTTGTTTATGTSTASITASASVTASGSALVSVSLAPGVSPSSVATGTSTVTPRGTVSGTASAFPSASGQPSTAPSYSSAPSASRAATPTPTRTPSTTPAPSKAVVKPGAPSPSTSPAPVPLNITVIPTTVNLQAIVPGQTQTSAVLSFTVTRTGVSIALVCSRPWCQPMPGQTVPVTLLQGTRRFTGAVHDIALTVQAADLPRGVHNAELTVQAVLGTKSVQRVIKVVLTVSAAEVQVAYSGGDVVSSVGDIATTTLVLSNTGNAAADLQVAVQPPPAELSLAYHRGYVWANTSELGVVSSENQLFMPLRILPGQQVAVNAIAPGAALRPLRAGTYAAQLAISGNALITPPTGEGVIASDATTLALLWKVRAASLFVYPVNSRYIAQSGQLTTLPTFLYTLRSSLPVDVQLDQAASSKQVAPVVRPGHALLEYTLPAGGAPTTVYRMLHGNVDVLGLNATVAAGQWPENTVRAKSATPGSAFVTDQSTYGLAVLVRHAQAGQSSALVTGASELHNWPITQAINVRVDMHDAGGFRTDTALASSSLQVTLVPVASALDAQQAELVSIANTAGVRLASLQADQLGLHEMAVRIGDSSLASADRVYADLLVSVTAARCPANYTKPSSDAKTCVCEAGAGRPLSNLAAPCALCEVGQVSVLAPGSEDRLCVQCRAGSFSRSGQQGSCTPCPIGAVCTDGRIRVQPGYYVAAKSDWTEPSTVSLQPCIRPTACEAPAEELLYSALHAAGRSKGPRGSSRARALAAASNISTTCKDGAAGILCGTCQPSYAMTPGGCVECNSTQSELLMTVAAAVLGMACAFAWLLRSLRNTIQSIRSVKDGSESDAFPLVRVALNWLQTYAIITALPIVLPPGFRGGSAAAGSVSQLSPLSISALHCAMSTSWEVKWWLSLAGFALMLCTAPVITGGALALWRRMCRRTASSPSHGARSYSARTFTLAVAVMLYLLFFAPVLLLLLAPFDEFNATVDDHRLLRADTAVDVTSSQMQLIRVVASAGLVVWIGVGPVGLLLLLLCNRRAIRKANTGRETTRGGALLATVLAPLYSSYRVHSAAIAFECVVLLRKVIMVAIPLVLVGDGYAQCACLTLVFFGSAVLQQVISPFNLPSVNRMEFVTLVVLTATLPALSVYSARTQEDQLLMAQSVAASNAQATQDDLTGSLSNVKGVAWVYWALLAAAHVATVGAFVYYLVRGMVTRKKLKARRASTVDYQAGQLRVHASGGFNLYDDSTLAGGEDAVPADPFGPSTAGTPCAGDRASGTVFMGELAQRKARPAPVVQESLQIEACSSVLDESSKQQQALSVSVSAAPVAAPAAATLGATRLSLSNSATP